MSNSYSLIIESLVALVFFLRLPMCWQGGAGKKTHKLSAVPGMEPGTHHLV